MIAEKNFFSSFFNQLAIEIAPPPLLQLLEMLLGKVTSSLRSTLVYWFFLLS